MRHKLLDYELVRISEGTETARGHKLAAKYHAKRIKKIETGLNSLKRPQLEAASLHREALRAHRDAEEANQLLERGKLDPRDFPKGLEPEDAVVEVSRDAHIYSRRANKFEATLGVEKVTRVIRVDNQLVLA